nr:MAG TPA: hypothetical protein [Caudoviricetes sp.]
MPLSDHIYKHCGGYMPPFYFVFAVFTYPIMK